MIPLATISVIGGSSTQILTISHYMLLCVYTVCVCVCVCVCVRLRVCTYVCVLMHVLRAHVQHRCVRICKNLKQSMYQ